MKEFVMSFEGFSLRYLFKEDEWNGNDELDEEDEDIWEEEDDELDKEDWDEDLEDEEDEEAKPLN
jgi:hypothetical protein